MAIEAEVTSLLERGAPVDERDDQGSTALMYAASGGKPTIVKKLIVIRRMLMLQDYAEAAYPVTLGDSHEKGRYQKRWPSRMIRRTVH